MHQALHTSKSSHQKWSSVKRSSLHMQQASEAASEPMPRSLHACCRQHSNHRFLPRVGTWWGWLLSRAPYPPTKAKQRLRVGTCWGWLLSRAPYPPSKAKQPYPIHPVPLYVSLAARPPAPRQGHINTRKEHNKRTPQRLVTKPKHPAYDSTSPRQIHDNVCKGIIGRTLRRATCITVQAPPLKQRTCIPSHLATAPDTSSVVRGTSLPGCPGATTAHKSPCPPQLAPYTARSRGCSLVGGPRVAPTNHWNLH